MIISFEFASILRFSSTVFRFPFPHYSREYRFGEAKYDRIYGFVRRSWVILRFYPLFPRRAFPEPVHVNFFSLSREAKWSFHPINVEFGISFRVNEYSTAIFRFYGKRKGKKEKMEKSFELSVTREPEANNFIRIRKESGFDMFAIPFSRRFVRQGETSFFVPCFAYSTRLDFASK